MIQRPPCWPEGEPQPNRCAARYYRQEVYGEFDLTQDFAGFKTRGNYLVSPTGHRITVLELRRLIELYGTKRGTRAKVIEAESRVAAPAPACPASTCSRCADLRGMAPMLKRLVLLAEPIPDAEGPPPDETHAPGQD